MRRMEKVLNTLEPLVSTCVNLSAKWYRNYVISVQSTWNTVLTSTTAFPLLKETYEGKFIELDFSQNLSLRPKDELQSAHFSGKQFTLHCSIVEPTEYRYHYHLSDDTKQDPFFVDVVLRDIISKYKIQNEYLQIQSDNAPSQYKNKHAFSLYQKLAEDFNLRIIRTYGAAGHGKGVIDAMSSLGAKNILRHDIFTQNIFFNDSESITNYLAMKKPEFSYTNLPALSIITKHNLPHIPKEIKDCMKQYMMIYESGKEVVLKECICECDPCRRFDFEECENDSKEEHSEVEIDDYFGNEELDSNQEEQIFDFIEIPSFVTLFTGASSEPLYLVKVVSKGIADERLSDSWDRLILPKSRYFTGHYLKLARSRNILTKKFDLIPLTVYITPDEIYDSYIEIDENLFLDSKIYDAFMQKVKI